MEFLRKIWRWAESSHGKLEAVRPGDGAVLSLGQSRGASFAEDYVKFEGKFVVGGDFAQFWIATRRDGKRSAVRIWKHEEVDASDLQRLRNEAKLLHALEHENVAVLHGWYEEPGAFYTAIELCNGGELFEWTAKRKNYSEEKARNIIKCLLSAVDHLHRHGIVIRNLKPEHLLLSDPSDHATLKITDLKFATDDGKDEFPFHEQTRSAEYNAPETSKEKCGPPADIWCVGTFMFILVGGYYPFRAYNEATLLKKIKTGKVEFEEANWGWISPSVKDLIQRMLMLEPRERISAAQALEHEWMTSESEDLARKNLEHNLGLFITFNAKRKFKQAVTGIVFLIYASRLMDSESKDSATVEHAFRVVESLIKTPACIEKGAAQETPEVPPTPATVAASSISSSGFEGFTKLDSLNASAWNTSSTSIAGADEDLQKRPFVESERVLPPIADKCPDLPGRVTLAKTLGPGPAVFDQSLNYGVRLTVQDACHPDPDPSGPVCLEKTAARVNCGGKTWSMGTKVICAPNGAKFSPPLLLEFFVRHGVSDRKSEDELKEILGEYQVLRKEEADTRWEAVPHKSLKLIRRPLDGEESTHIEVEVDHFTSFCGCCKVDHKMDLPESDFSNTRAVLVKNQCGKDLFVVSVPATLTERESTSAGVGASVNAVGFGVGVTHGQAEDTSIIHPNTALALAPARQTIRRGYCGNFDLQSKGQYVFLIVCTVDELPPAPLPALRLQRSGESYTESKNDMAPPSVVQTAPGDRVEADTIMLKCWGFFPIYGGRQVEVTQDYLSSRIPESKEMTRNQATERKLANGAIEMSGLGPMLSQNQPQEPPPQANPGGRTPGFTSKLMAKFRLR